jgi:hypothetical protein
MAAPEFHELQAPPDAIEQGGHEVVRAVVVEGAVSVAMRRSFDDPFVWGVLLVDLARHAARIYAAEAGLAEDEAMARIVEGIQSELDTPTDHGTTTAAH